MTDPRFEPDNINPKIGHEARDAMCDLVLAWATYDSLVAQWIVVSFGLPMDHGAILVGNMDTKTKLDRLDALYRHHKLSGASSIKNLKKEHLSHVEVRNRICHAHCAGTFKTEPERVVFAPVKATIGELGNMAVEAIHVDQMRAATRFAERAAGNINRLIDTAFEPRK